MSPTRRCSMLSRTWTWPRWPSPAQPRSCPVRRLLAPSRCLTYRVLALWRAGRRAAGVNGPGVSCRMSDPIRNIRSYRPATRLRFASLKSATSPLRPLSSRMPQEAKPGWLWGPFSRLGLSIALITLIVDQAHKWWMLNVYRIEEKGRVSVLPFLDLVYVKNLGVSYGLGAGVIGQGALVAFALIASLGLAVWLARGEMCRLTAVSIGLLIGGAIGNAI